MTDGLGTVTGAVRMSPPQLTVTISHRLACRYPLSDSGPANGAAMAQQRAAAGSRDRWRAPYPLTVSPAPLHHRTATSLSAAPV